MNPITLPTTRNMKLFADKAKRMKKRKPSVETRPLRIDHRTVIYVPVTATEKEIETIKSRYQKHK